MAIFTTRIAVLMLTPIQPEPRRDWRPGGACRLFVGITCEPPAVSVAR